MRKFVRGQVESVEMASASMRRIRICGPGLAGLDWTPGQQVQVLVGLGRQLGSRLPGPLRTYSVWAYSGDAVELCVYDHGDGPGARWARAMEPGRETQFTTPDGKFVLQPGAYHVFAGEETAAAAFGPMMRALPAGAGLHGVIEVDGPDDRLPLPDAITWRYRNGASAASSTELVKAVAGLELPAGPGVAYVAGEARTVQAVRKHLVEERGWPRRSVLVKPFWSPGKKGMD